MSGSPTNQIFCDNCKTPSPLTPSEVSDLSWAESFHQHVCSWLLIPGRWPFGYLVASPYSPLQVERNLPGRNWRDAFEDLLALENRGAMIDPEVRAREMKAAEAVRASQAAERIRKLNELHRRSVADIGMMQRILVISKERNQQDLIKASEHHIQREYNKISSRSAFAATILASVNNPAPMTRVTSAYSKTRGHWMASLATSGACPGWTSILANSADGPLWQFAPVSGPHEEGQWDLGCNVTEKELSDVFEGGEYFSPATPGPSPHDQNTADVSQQERAIALQMAVMRTIDEIGQHDDRWRLRPKATILRQILFSNVNRKARSSDEVFKVRIINEFTDGRAETKEIVDNPSAVLREVERAGGDISDRNIGLDQESYDETKESRDGRLNMIAMVELAIAPDGVVVGTDIEDGTENA